MRKLPSGIDETVVVVVADKLQPIYVCVYTYEDSNLFYGDEGGLQIVVVFVPLLFDESLSHDFVPPSLSESDYKKRIHNS